MTPNEERTFAEAYGAKSKPDSRRGPNWCQYMLYGWYIWQCVLWGKKGKYIGWKTARIKNNRFTDHHSHNTLEDALEFVCYHQTGEVK